MFFTCGSQGLVGLHKHAHRRTQAIRATGDDVPPASGGADARERDEEREASRHLIAIFFGLRRGSALGDRNLADEIDATALLPFGDI